MSVKVVEIPKKSGKWYIRVNWCFVNSDTGTRRKWRKTKLVGIGKDGYEAAIAKASMLNSAYAKFGVDAIKLIEPEIPGGKPIPTLKEYSEKFLARMRQAGLKRSTLAMYESNVRIHLEPALGRLELTEIDYSCIADMLSEKAQANYSSGRFRVEQPLYKRNFRKPRPTPKRFERPEAVRKPYSRDTIRLIAMTLRALMSEAVRDKLISFNPVTGLSRFYKKKRRDRQVNRSDVFTAEELHQIEDKMADRYPEYYEFVLAMSREGMRIGEAVALTIHDIDFGRNTFLVNKNVPSGMGGELEVSAKTEPSDREDEFWSEDLPRALKAMLARRRQQYLACGEEMPELLFCETSGHQVDYSRFVKAWNRVQKLAGVRQRSPHSLRHTWSSYQISAGEDIASVSKHLGHSNPAVTLGIYTHFLPGRRRVRGNVLDRNRTRGEKASANTAQMGNAKTDDE